MIVVGIISVNKISAFRRIRHFISFQKAKLIQNAFVLSMFRYCPLIWVFCSKTLNNIISKTHKKSLKVLYNIEEASLTELLAIDKSDTIHTQNLRVLVTEVFKSLNGLNPKFMQDLYEIKKYSQRKDKCLVLPSSK